MIGDDLFYSYKNNIAVITNCGEKYSYKDLFSFSKLLNKKIKTRSLIFCLSNNSIGSLIGYITFIKNNVIPLMLDSAINNEFLNQLIKIYKPQYLWMPNELKKNFQHKTSEYNMLGYSLFKISLSKKFEYHPDLSLLLATSGSTGSPKLIRLKYENIYSNAKSISEYLSINKNERPITSLPMHYSFGLSIINSHLLNGSTILLTNNSLFEKQFWSFLKSYRATSISGVPYTFEILKRLRFFKMDLPDLKTITQAGGRLDDKLNCEFSEYCKKLNKKFYVMYGQTEATARISYLPYDKSLMKLGSIGIAIPGGKLSLIDKVGNIIDIPNKRGELVYEGKNVSLGYAETLKDLNKGDENNGILLTGDIAKRDEDGYYYIVGRKKRFIKLFGNRINLDEVEILIKKIISDCVCTGKDDRMIIYIKKIDKSKSKKIIEYISKKIGINQSAFIVKFIDSIPKNSSGKIIYSTFEN